ncbi:hypothetical protein D915_005176 [Fasciola hepatica]|uniref:Coiled-coil domain-containing protein n=1 Tax=Fasciola hepatica TaxID=6192 RepID=A0A4E0RBM6_FASHE|nr:hypothetical protein D915_005176 [Fasciola hepatica]
MFIYLSDCESKARLEEANIVAKETEMNRMHFDKNVTALLTDFQECPSDEAVKKRTEAFIRFHKSYMKHLVSTENNLRIENGSLLRRRKKDRKVLRDLSESEISPSQIEMEELQIRCNRALQKILQFAHVCAHMKSVLVRATHSMTIGRTELEKSLAESGWLQRECNHAEGLVKLVRGNMKTTETSLEEERRINDHLKLILKKYRVPSTITYVNNVVESSKLSRANRAYKNKLYLAKISLAKHKDLWSKIKKNLG